jgi:hypothetical protein
LKIDVHGNINVKRRIVVNGREYASVEEMPDDIRRAYEQAMAGAGGGTHASGASGVRARVVFNGREYLDVDTMPEDVRRLYEAAVNAARGTGHAETGGRPLGPGTGQSVPSPSMAPIVVGGTPLSPTVKVAVIGFVILVVLGVLYYLWLRP